MARLNVLLLGSDSFSVYIANTLSKFSHVISSVTITTLTPECTLAKSVAAATNPDTQQGQPPSPSPTTCSSLSNRTPSICPVEISPDVPIRTIEWQQVKRGEGSIDVLIAASFGAKIPSSAIRRLTSQIECKKVGESETRPIRAINLHGSWLPFASGPAPLHAQLQGGSEWLGVTVHEVSPKLDRGRVLARAGVPVEPADAAGLGTMQAAAARLTNTMLPRVLSLIQSSHEVPEASLTRRIQGLARVPASTLTSEAWQLSLLAPSMRERPPASTSSPRAGRRPLFRYNAVQLPLHAAKVSASTLRAASTIASSTAAAAYRSWRALGSLRLRISAPNGEERRCKVSSMEQPITGLGRRFLEARSVPSNGNVVVDMEDSDEEVAAIRAELARCGMPSTPGQALVDHKTNELLVCSGDYGLLRLTGLRVDGRTTVTPVQLAAGMRCKKSARFMVGPDNGLPVDA